MLLYWLILIYDVIKLMNNSLSSCQFMSKKTELLFRNIMYILHQLSMIFWTWYAFDAQLILSLHAQLYKNWWLLSILLKKLCRTLTSLQTIQIWYLIYVEHKSVLMQGVLLPYEFLIVAQNHFPPDMLFAFCLLPFYCNSPLEVKTSTAEGKTQNWVILQKWGTWGICWALWRSG